MFARATGLDVLKPIDGVHLRALPPFSTLLFWTVHSVYRVVIGTGPQVYVQGGAHFDRPTAASLDGVTRSGRRLTGGWIGVGVRLHIRAPGQWIVTSPVLTMATEAPTDRVH